MLFKLKRKLQQEDSIQPTHARAILRNLRSSPRKANIIAELIRGEHVYRALDYLRNCKRAIASDFHKLLMSAIANAENNHNMNVDLLFIDEAYVGKAMVLKRFRAKSRGRAGRILKPFSHVTITVKEEKGV